MPKKDVPIPEFLRKLESTYGKQVPSWRVDPLRPPDKSGVDPVSE